MMKTMLGLGGSARARGAAENAARSDALRIEAFRNIARPSQTKIGRPNTRPKRGRRMRISVRLCWRSLGRLSSSKSRPPAAGRRYRVFDLGAPVAARQMRRDARPAPVLGPLDEPRSDRVQRHIARRRHQMLLVHRRRAEPRLEQMPGHAEPGIDRGRIAPMGLTGRAAKRRFNSIFGVFGKSCSIISAKISDFRLNLPAPRACAPRGMARTTSPLYRAKARGRSASVYAPRATSHIRSGARLHVDQRACWRS